MKASTYDMGIHVLSRNCLTLFLSTQSHTPLIRHNWFLSSAVRDTTYAMLSLTASLTPLTQHQHCLRHRGVQGTGGF